MQGLAYVAGGPVVGGDDDGLVGVGVDGVEPDDGVEHAEGLNTGDEVVLLAHQARLPAL